MLNVLGALLAFVIIIIIYLGSMGVYICLRKRYPGTKYVIELTIIVLGIIFSVIIKTIAMVMADPQTIELGFEAFLNAVYASLGSLTFEGLPSHNNDISSFLEIFYISSSLYVGVMFVSIVTTKASYEVYSWVLLSILRLKIRKKQNLDLYIFTAVTPDALLLVKSIEDEYKDKSNHPAYIIFAGEDLEPFERKNPLHRDILANGYIYWPYAKIYNNDKDASLLRRLKLFIDNDFKKGDLPKKQQTSRIHYFALQNNLQLSGLEALNSSVVFNEISAMVRELIQKKVSFKSIINFYILTDADINYQFYEEEVKRVVNEALGSYASEAEFENLSTYFQLHIINEALIAGRGLSRARIKEYQADGTRPLKLYNQPNTDGTYKVAVLGFGKNGEQALHSLFVDTTFLDEQGIPSQLNADIFDPHSEDGLYAFNHPLHLCSQQTMANLNEFSALNQEQNIVDFYKEGLAKYLNTQQGPIKDLSDVKKFMKFPILNFFKESSFGLPFYDFFNGKDNLAQTNKVIQKYQAIIITLGDDEDNILMGNALIDLLKHHFVCNNHETFPLQTIYINLRDEKNYKRINWNDEDRKRFSDLKIVLFGNRQDIYSYSEIIDDIDDMKYHFGYRYIADDNNATFNDIKETLFNEDEPIIDYFSHFAILSKQFASIDINAFLKEWLTVSMFKKDSNRAACRFKPYFTEQLNALEKLTKKDLLHMAWTEHTRWNRFYMANGWVYQMYPKNNGIDKNTPKSVYQLRKEHNCLCPIDFIDHNTQSYDVVNVAIAYKEGDQDE